MSNLSARRRSGAISSLGNTVSDADLIHRLRNGDSAAEEELSRRYINLVFWLVTHAAKGESSRVDIEEVKSDCLIHFLRSARVTFDPKRGTFRSFISKCIYREARRSLSKNHAKLSRLTTISLEREWVESGFDSVCTESADAIALVESDEYQRVAAVFEISGPRYRAIIQAMIAGAEPADIARRLGISRQAMHKITQKLRNRVSDVA